MQKLYGGIVLSFFKDCVSPGTKCLARNPGERRRDVPSVRAGGVQWVGRWSE